MAAQLPLDLSEPPKAPRKGALRSYHVRSHTPAGEALAGEQKALLQDFRVLEIFRACAKDADREDPQAGQRLTPSQVLVAWKILYDGRQAPPITSIRRAITNLTTHRLLVHYPGDRRPGPLGKPESTWGLAQMRRCTGPCGRLLSVVAFDGEDVVCERCRLNAALASDRGAAAFARNLALARAALDSRSRVA